MRLLQRLAAHAAKKRREAALVGDDQTWSWERLAEEVEKRGNGVGTMTLCRGNEPEFVAEFLGAMAAGRPVLCLSREMPEAERRTLSEKVSGKGPAVLLPSSGTTGLPKIVRRSAASLDAMSEALGFESTDRVVAVVPLCHSYGLEHGLLGPVWAGSCVRLLRRFDAGVVAREINSATVFPGVPFMFEALAGVGEKARLRRVYSAGGRLGANRFGAAIGQVYGTTEVGSVTYGEDSASVGKALKGVEIRIDGGQVEVRSPWMFEGYAGETKRQPGEFFQTGDLGRIDEAGNLLITGRLKLMIDVGGKKVNLLEVESVIAAHPEVAECVVTPMVVAESMTRLKAVVTRRRAGSGLTAEELRRYVKERLAAYKAPRVIEIREELPKSASGKILRGQVDG